MATNSSILQSEVIDVTSWPVDEIFETYPEGARSKTAFFPPERVGLPYIIPKRRYLYKRSRQRYPDQFWAEIVAYLVGGLLQVPVPPAYAAVNKADGDCGALIEWFYEDGKAQFVAGGQYMQEQMPDYDRKRGLQHNFRSVQIRANSFEEAGVAGKEWQQWWCDAFMFDALIGNTDRHQDNWGYLIVRERAGGTYRASLSPLFDNGTSLGHELFTENVMHWDRRRYLEYISRGKHHMKWKVGDSGIGCGHVDMLRNMARKFPSEFAISRKKLADFDVATLGSQLESLCKLQLYVPLTLARKNLYIELIAIRRQCILEAIQ